MTDELKPDLFSQEEVARRLGISRTTVWRLVKAGELEAIRLGSRTLIPRRSVERMLASHAVGAQAPGGFYLALAVTSGRVCSK